MWPGSPEDEERDAGAAAFNAGIEALLVFYAPDVVCYPAPGWVAEKVCHGHEGIRRLSSVWAGSTARFGGVEPREEVALGAEQHDVGWALFDLEPRLSPATGLPRSFLELTPEEHLAIWRDAPDHLLSQSLHAALVVSLHGRSLSELRARSLPEQAAVLQPHIDRERDRQATLVARLGLSEADVERLRRQMWTWDSISLALC